MFRRTQHDSGDREGVPADAIGALAPGDGAVAVRAPDSPAVKAQRERPPGGGGPGRPAAGGGLSRGARSGRSLDHIAGPGPRPASERCDAYEAAKEGILRQTNNKFPFTPYLPWQFGGHDFIKPPRRKP